MMDNHTKRVVTPVTFTQHALDRLAERAPSVMVDADLARHIGVNYQTAAAVYQQPIRGPSPFCVIELPSDTSVYALCAKEDDQIVVRTVLPAEYVARSFTAGIWTFAPTDVLEDHEYILRWRGPGNALRFQSCRDIAALRVLSQKLIDSGVLESSIEVWTRDQTIRIRTHRVVTVEK